MISTIEAALVVDDDVLMREFVVETLRRAGIHVTELDNGLTAKQRLEEQPFDMAFIDLKMPGLDGMQLLEYMKKHNISTIPVIMTAFGTVERAVEAMRMGAYDFLMKPFSPEQVELILKRAKEWIGLKAQNTYLMEELGWALPRGRQLIGQSTVMRAVMGQIERVAKSDATVLINGESGTGKELVALAIHTLSARAQQPFIRMNCAAIPESLMDSELFGHEKGSFTSAINRRIGRFELAHQGTLLLDEISEMDVALQAKLLRVLQEREFERVGGNRTIRTDCRVLATTNRNLKRQVDEGRFRQDLYFRLNVVPITMPPLRDRPEDIPILVDAFLKRNKGGRSKRSRIKRVTDETMNLLQQYAWPGNIRELENVVERLCVMVPGEEISPAALPEEILHTRPTLFIEEQEHEEEEASSEVVYSIPEMERRTIVRALRATGGNRRQTAALLDISVRTLRNKLNQYRQERVLPADI